MIFSRRYCDALGSVVALADPSGSLVETYRYDIFGRPDKVSGVGNPYLFTCRRYDGATGLYYFRSRSYHPGIGRFLEADPLRKMVIFANAGPTACCGGRSVGSEESKIFALLPSGYLYVGNSPVNRVDAVGLQPIDLDPTMLPVRVHIGGSLTVLFVTAGYDLTEGKKESVIFHSKLTHFFH